jgi:hypothetical protein
MATVGAIGELFDDTFRHAKELLDIMEGELAELEPERHSILIAAAPILRAKLERLRDELLGGMAH